MSGSKRSEWQPGGIELLDVSHLYPHDVLDKIARVLKPKQPIDMERFENQIVNIAGMLNAEAHYEGRPTSKQVRTSLEALSRRLADTQKHLSELDPDSLARIGEVARLDPVNIQVEHAPEMFLSNIGVERYTKATRALSHLARWVELAFQTVPAAVSGRKPEEAMQSAVDSLCALFQDYTGQKPTLAYDPKRGTTGRVLEFARAALKPLLNELSIESDLTHYVSECLYRRGTSDAD